MVDTHRVVVFDLRTNTVELDATVDIALAGSNADTSRTDDPDHPAIPQPQWDALLAAYVAAPSICPWDCDGCNTY